MTGPAVDLSSLLDVEEIDRDLFRAPSTTRDSGRPALYGGQVAAQALAAAGRTVPDSRVPHSLHGYFLRPGDLERPVIFHVNRDRDGGSFSARQVRALQAGEVIFSMIASFHAEQATDEMAELLPRDVPPPESLPMSRRTDLLEVHEVTPSRREEGVFSDCQWVRVTCCLPDDRLVQACALTFLSDLGSGFGQLQIPGVPRGGPSVDHALWFHDPIRADDWVLLDLRPAKIRGGRGLYTGTLTDRNGALGAFLVQEMLLRWGPVAR